VTSTVIYLVILAVVLIILAVVLIGFIVHRLSSNKNRQYYWEGRGDGWFACENMTAERIRKFYPSQSEEMLKNIIQ